MMTAVAKNSTPAPAALRPRPTDADFAQAYRDLEHDVGDARSAVLIVKCVREATIGSDLETMHSRMIKEALPALKDMRIIVLSEDEADALDHALDLVGERVGYLHRKYHRAFDGRSDEPRRTDQ